MATVSSKLKIGDKLWYVPGSRYGKPHEATVSKVGRIWFELSDATFSNARFSIETLCLDGRGYSMTGRCYRSRDEYEAEVALHSAWVRFRKIISDYHRPDSVKSAEQVQEAMKVLGISLIKTEPQ